MAELTHRIVAIVVSQDDPTATVRFRMEYEHEPSDESVADIKATAEQTFRKEIDADAAFDSVAYLEAI